MFLGKQFRSLTASVGRSLMTGDRSSCAGWQELRHRAAGGAPGSRCCGRQETLLRRRCAGRQEESMGRAARARVWAVGAAVAGSMTRCAWWQEPRRRGGRSCCVGRERFAGAASALSRVVRAVAPGSRSRCSLRHCSLRQEMLLRVANPCARHCRTVFQAAGAAAPCGKSPHARWQGHHCGCRSHCAG